MVHSAVTKSGKGGHMCCNQPDSEFELTSENGSPVRKKVADKRISSLQRGKYKCHTRSAERQPHTKQRKSTEMGHFM